MSKDNTYRPAVLPSEAVMIPAVEESPDTSHQADLSEAGLEEAARVPARAGRVSGAVERLRSRMRGIDVSGAQWINTEERPLDGPSIQTAKPANPHPERQENRLMAQGTALSTLMRSATRQHSKTPELTPFSHTTGLPQRDALRKVVQGAQLKPPTHPLL